MLDSLLENIHELSVLLLLLCTFFFYRHLKKLKRERKLTAFEFCMLIITQIAYLLWAALYLITILGKN
ncbi:hypothetical protein N7Z68_13335 [Alkalihalobacillus sp. MEB203]|uniref:Uncharacterized protein n=1 Tax=Alkalihalobacterium chitinilyticum TaxID=2980103 RepID=A0ABT5VIT3_9BACI|nr:hypothetical protein [Alkalihalobacterium chitinilyticum]MDE5414358.1 hypothetical protein [Alkalihalobacterium chitinilyticum]